MAGRIALLAGSGALPRALAQTLTAQGQPPVVVRFNWTEEVWEGPGEVLPARLEHLGALFASLARLGCDRVAMAGGMRRPRLDPKAGDATFRAAAPRLVRALQAGDDAALRLVAALFEEEGLILVAAQEIAPELLAHAGALGVHRPGPADLADAARARAVAEALGALDVGQGAVVAQGLCLGLETVQGTDALLDFVAGTATPFRPDPDGARGVLWKGPKPGQDRRFDLPAIGPDTVRGAARAGLAGIALAAGGVLVLNRAETLRAADATGLFIWGVP
ncbi:MAG: UDP-2,3-diacylglucosamine diphosphatase LpxI [Rhodobacteraceae bacterium]|nr:UDP-2,3-diacylglucosamine diphosphatase LpxI [Paracoccaceae bacterium]